MKIYISDMSRLNSIKVELDSPWNYFQKEIHSNGHTVTSDLANADLLILNGIRPARKVMKKKSLRYKPRVLILWEPPSNSGLEWDKAMKAGYIKVFKPSPFWNTFDNPTEIFDWPQGENTLKENFECEEGGKVRNRACLILSNKISFHMDELYSLRREVANRSEHLDVFGFNWRSGTTVKLRALFSALMRNPTLSFFVRSRYFFSVPVGFKGLSKDKTLTHNRYHMSVVIENSGDYVSEKLIDCIASKSAPLYIGPPLELFGIPNEVAISVKPDFNEIENCISNYLHKPKELEAIIKAGQNFLKSTEFKNHINAAVFSRIARSVCKEISQIT